MKHYDVTWLVHTWYKAFMCVPWLIATCDLTQSLCDMTHSYVYHDSLICVPWPIHMCDMTHWYVWHDSLICVPWLVDMCAVTHWYVCHDSFICMPRLIDVCRDSLICCAATQLHVSRIVCYSGSICLCIYGTRLVYIWNDYVWYAQFIRGSRGQKVCCSVVQCGAERWGAL